MKCVVNGRPIEVVVHDEDTGVDVLRDGLGLTGTKLSCGSGTCGACTVLADQVPICACLLPAADLAGRSITTIEQYAAADHPVQRAFMFEDAMQCGYCTPGFVLQGIAFFEAWRAAHGRREPPADAIVAACAGHLCRCGAYPHIRRAIARACAGDYDAAPAGHPPRHDAHLKVTGAATYTVDVRLPGQLEGRILRSPVAHADIDRVDLEAAAAIVGVLAVVDLTNGGRRVRYAGQELAAVAAIDRHTAQRALDACVVELSPLPAALGAAAASAPDAPRVYPSIFETKVSESELPVLPTLWRDNLRGPTFVMSHHGIAADSLIDEAEAQGHSGLIHQQWHASTQSHTPLEPHACVAHWTAEDAVDVYLSTQACADLAIDIADRWNLPRDHVRVRCAFVGGAFGAKADLTMEAVAAIELSRAAGRPVRVALGSDEELVTGGYRPAVDIDLALDVADNGTMRAMSLKARCDGGVAIGSTVAAVARFPYPDVPKWLADYDVVSHAPPAKPFRGPGGPAAFWALEQTVDIAARQLQIDPVAFRRMNDADPRLHALLDWVESIPAWRDRAPNRSDARVLRGVGLATGTWTAFVHNDTSVTVSAGPGGIIVSCASQDIGGGSRTVLAEIVAAVFGVSPASIDVRIGDSHYVRASMSSGSRTTASIGPAAEAAAIEVRARRAELAALGTADTETTEITARRPTDPGGYVLPMALEGFLLGRARPVSAHVCEVEVDRKTGRVVVPRLWTGLAVGRVRVPVLARSQAIGGAIQGVSYALYEERRLDPQTGRTLTQCLDDHRMCGLADAPEIDVHFLDGEFDTIAGGAVGLGELTTIAVAASVGNGVFDATGWRPASLPLRIEHVLAALRARPTEST